MRKALLIFFAAVGSLTMAFAGQSNVETREPVKSELKVIQVSCCPYCSSENHQVPLSPQSKKRKKFGPEKCGQCDGYGRVSDVTADGKVKPRARKCDVCEGTGGKPHCFIDRWKHCGQCRRDFDFETTQIY